MTGLGFALFPERKNETLNNTLMKSPQNKAVEIPSMYLYNILTEKKLILFIGMW